MENQTMDEPIFATYGNQKTYWITATCFSFLGVLALLRIAVDYRHNSNYRKPIVRCFGPMMFGDVLFVINYLPYHSYNSIQALKTTGGEFDPGDSPLCRISWYIAANAVMFELLGLVLISSAPWVMLQNAKRLRNLDTIYSQQKILFFYLFNFLMGAIWFSVDYTNTGSFKKLYCGPKTWASFSGAWMFSWIAISFCAVGFFTLNSVLLIRKMIQSNATRPSSKGKASSQNILKYGIFMTVSFLLCFGCFAISTLMNIIGEYPSIEMEMIAGLTIKLKTVIDCFLLYNLEVLRKGRNITSASAVTTTQKAKSSSTSTMDKV